MRVVNRTGMQRHADVALPRDLGGIHDQVGDDLAKPARVGANLRDITVMVVNHREVMPAHLRCDHANGVADHIVQVKPLVMQGRGRTADAGQVEHVVKHPQHGPARLRGEVQVALLRRGQLGSAHQVDQAQQAVQRGAQFMAGLGHPAHAQAVGLIGLGFGLDLGSGFGLVRPTLQRGVGAFALDVVNVGQRAQHHSASVGQLLHPGALAKPVPLSVAELQAAQQHVGVVCLCNQRRTALPVVRM